MTTIQTRLFSLQDTAYRDFHTALIPTVDCARVIGVRVPLLRALAKELSGSPQAQDFLRALPHQYYDEDMLHAALLALGKDFEETQRAVAAFLPYLDNWAVCDALRPKVFSGHPEKLSAWASTLLSSTHTYTVRFGIGLLLSYLLDDDFSPVYLEKVAAIRSEEYYVNMMAAWYFATALAKQYDAALPYLMQRRLPPWTHAKTIQKALESFRISKERKDLLRTLR